MPGGKGGRFPGIERMHQSEEYKKREVEDKLLRSVGRDRLLELARAEKAGRLVVLPEGTVSMLMAKFVDAGDSDMFTPSVETRGSENRLIPLLSLAASAVAQAHQMDYKLLLAAMISNPPIVKETLGKEANNEADSI